MLKMPETIVCGDIGLVLLSGLGSRRTHPVGAEGATMARRAPFPLSSIPAYIDQSMKLFVCLSASHQQLRLSSRTQQCRLLHQSRLACVQLIQAQTGYEPCNSYDSSLLR